MDIKEYTEANREAWNEVQPRHAAGRKRDIGQSLRDGAVGLDPEVLAHLRGVDLNGAAVGQFCCNNGEELLSFFKLGVREAIGFDISDRFIDEAQALARDLGLNARFVRSDIYDIEGFGDRFDLLYLSVGTLGWFPDIGRFFGKAAAVLKPGGTLLVFDSHPVLNLFALPGEEKYSAACPSKVAYSYFRKEPLVGEDGIDYVGGTVYQAKPNYWFMHRLSDIINGVTANGMTVARFEEYARSADAVSGHLGGLGIPMTFLLEARKNR